MVQETPARAVKRRHPTLIGRVDVARIAETHGGGGHRNAAGYTSPLPEAR